MQLYARWFAARGPLADERRRAGETIFAIVSPDVGRLLCDELGWSRKQHAAWVADMLKRGLCYPPRRLLPFRPHPGFSS